MRVSVIIPCRNAEDFLGPTLESVLNQTRQPDEIVVVDNGSTDDSLSVARSYGSLVSTITAETPGASAARNAGMAAANGDAVMFLDADDLLGPCALESLAAALARAPDAIACCPWFRLEETDGCWHSAPPSCMPRRAGLDDLGAWLTGWYHPPCSVLWSRAAYVRSGGWDPQVKVNNDGDVMMRGFVAGNRLVHTTEGESYYRRLPHGQLSLSGTRTTREGIEARLFVLRRIARMLAEGGRLRRYRGPLAEAFTVVAAECRAAFPDLHALCLQEIRRYGGAPWLQRARRIPMRVGRKLGHLQRRAHLALGPPPASLSAGARKGPTTPSPGAGTATVSIVIPTYNRAHLLPRALDSALSQSYADIEVLVVDDGSTDGTADLLAAYPDSRLRHIRQDRNRGVGAARNRGLREATGDLVAFLDSDDEWLPDKIARQVALFHESPRRVGLVYTGVETVDLNGHSRVDVPTHRGNLHGQLLLKNVLVGGSCAMIRRSVVSTVGYFDETLPAIEDYDFWLRIARFYDFDYVPAPLVRYFDRVTGDQQRDAQRRSLDFVANFAARQTFYERNRHEMQRARIEHLFLLESAKRHLRWPSGDPAIGRQHLIDAAAARPATVEPYARLIYALLPRPAKRLAATTTRLGRQPATPVAQSRQLWGRETGNPGEALRHAQLAPDREPERETIG